MKVGASNPSWIKTIFMDYFLSYFCTINKQYHIPFMRSYLKTDRWWFKVILITSDQTWKHQTNENNNIFLIIHTFHTDHILNIDWIKKKIFLIPYKEDSKGHHKKIASKEFNFVEHFLILHIFMCFMFPCIVMTDVYGECEQVMTGHINY